MPLHTTKALLRIFKRPNHRQFTQPKTNSFMNPPSKSLKRYHHTSPPSSPNPKQPWYKNPLSEGLLLKPSWLFQSIGTFAASLVISTIFWKVGENEKGRKDKKDILNEVRHEADINWAKTQKILAKLELNTASNLSKINFKFIRDTQDIQTLEERDKALTLRLNQVNALENIMQTIADPKPANSFAISNKLAEQKQQIQQGISLNHCLLMCKLHRFDEALKDINTVTGPSKVNPWAENIRGLIYLEKYYRDTQDKNALHDAVQCFQSALKSNNALTSEDPSILGNLAYAYTVQGNYPQAMQTIQKAFALDAKHPMVLTSYAVMLLEQSLATGITSTYSNTLQQALSYFNAALYTAPSNPFILYYRGLLHMLLANPSCALQDFDEIKRVKSPGVSVSLQRGKLLIQLGRYQEALQDLDYANSFRQNDPIILYYRGIVLFKLGYTQAAKESFQQAQNHLNTNFNEQLSENISCDIEKLQIVNKQAFQAMVEQALSNPQVAAAKYASQVSKIQTDTDKPLAKLCLTFSNTYAQSSLTNPIERCVIEASDMIKNCDIAKTNKK